MFDAVGRDLDDTALSRTAASSLLTLLLSGSVAAGLFAAGLFTVHVRPPLPDPVEIMDIAFADPEPALTAPEPPAAPAAAAAAAAPAEPAPPADSGPATPPSAEAEPAPLPPQVSPQVAESAPSTGVADLGSPGPGPGGPGGAGGTGGPGGPGTGDGEGEGEGDGGGSPPRVIHHSDIAWKKRFEPVYPNEARGLGLGEQRCTVRIQVDEDGVPYGLTVEGCPKVFHEETREALLKWRAYPLKTGGQAVKFQSTILVKYREL